MNKSDMMRYSRQLLQIGKKGQDKLKKTKVLVVGAGGLGSPVLQYLASSGIGRIGIIDFDNIEISNLPRQVIHSKIGKSKVQSAKEAMQKVNSVKIDTYKKKLDETNAKAIIKKYDVVVDCCDNLETRFIMSDTCQKLKKPLVYGSAIGWNGMMTVFLAGKQSYRKLQKYMPTERMPRCSDIGVVSTVPGVIGMLQATEVMKLIIGLPTVAGYLVVYNAKELTFEKFKL